MLSSSFFNAYIVDIKELNAFSNVTSYGSDYLYQIELNDEFKETEEYDHIFSTKKFSEEQDKEGNPYLYNLVSVRAYGILEAFIDEFFISYINSNFELLNNNSFKKIKGSPIEFVFMSKQEQLEFLLNQVKIEFKINSKFGINKFESLLQLIDHNGQVDVEVSDHVFELSQVRNAIVHNNSKADQRLITNCPWLNLSIGEPIKLDKLKFDRYLGSVYWYVLEVFERHFNKTDRLDFWEFLSYLKSEQIKLIHELKKYKDLRVVRE